MSREIMQQALELLIAYQDHTGDFRIANKCGSTIQAIEAELAKPEQESVKPRSDYRDWDYQDLLDNPEQEPVAWMLPEYSDVISASETDGTGIYNIPLYALDEVTK